MLIRLGWVIRDVGYRAQGSNAPFSIRLINDFGAVRVHASSTQNADLKSVKCTNFCTKASIGHRSLSTLIISGHSAVTMSD